ncbi:hypothetical protein EPD60_15580 [Flaviaesturariibacter flavus]|uniref:Scramblase n=1 Tax=Flaviaesturariibacter flavus TaxID=2502780 RepID=A0A4R1B7R8_9BACT|nr:hypothetical protein [Flaviaesturariibacter flavus]TCJ12678.1 hypothetical protein EPD60_15580 [Flaviaesturariibacter flavus]
MVAELKTSATKADAFFGVRSYYVEERRTAIGGGNRSRLFDDAGHPAGALIQRTGFAIRFWRIFLKASLLPFRLELHDNSGRTVAAIRRGWTILRSRTEIVDGRDKVIGFLKHKDTARRPRIKVFNEEGKKIGEVTGTTGTWDMNIIDREYLHLGQIHAFAPETTPGETRGQDTYFVNIDGEGATPRERRLLLIVSIAIDRLLEHK